MKLHLPHSLRAALLASLIGVALIPGVAKADYTWSGGSSITDASWKSASSWTTSGGSTVSGNGPGTSGSNSWDPITISDARGALTDVTVEGWKLRLTLERTNLAINKLSKMQGDAQWIKVDKDSELSINFLGSGNSQGTMNMEIAGSVSLVLDKNLATALNVDFGAVSETEHGSFNVFGKGFRLSGLNVNVSIADAVSSTTAVTLHTVELGALTDLQTTGTFTASIGGEYGYMDNVELTADLSNVGVASVVNQGGKLTLYYVTGAVSSVSWSGGNLVWGAGTLFDNDDAFAAGDRVEFHEADAHVTLKEAVAPSKVVIDDGVNVSLGGDGSLSAVLFLNGTLTLKNDVLSDACTFYQVGENGILAVDSGENTVSLGSKMANFTGTLDLVSGTATMDSGDISFRVTGQRDATLTIGHNATLSGGGDGEAKLQITGGTTKFGTGQNQNHTLAFGAVQVDPNTTFEICHAAIDTKAELILNGGTLKSEDQDNGTGVKFSSLTVQQDSRIMYNYNGILDFGVLSGEGDLTIVPGGAANESHSTIFRKIKDYNGMVSGHVAANHSLTIGAVDEAYGLTCRINGDAKADSFAKTGNGNVVVNGTLSVLKELVVNYTGNAEIVGLNLADNIVLTYTDTTQKLLSLGAGDFAGASIINVLAIADQLADGINLGISADYNRENITLLGLTDDAEVFAQDGTLWVQGGAVDATWDINWGVSELVKQPTNAVRDVVSVEKVCLADSDQYRDDTTASIVITAVTNASAVVYGGGESVGTRSSWISMQNGGIKALVGGNKCDNVGDAARNFVGDSHINIIGGNVDFVIGGNSQSGQDVTFTGNTYVSVNGEGAVRGSIIGGSTGSNGMVTTLNGDTNIFVNVPLVQTASPSDLDAIPASAIIGGNQATGLAAKAVLVQNGNTNITVDLSKYFAEEADAELGGGEEPATDEVPITLVGEGTDTAETVYFDKSIIGGTAFGMNLTDAETSYSQIGDANITIKADNRIHFAKEIVGGVEYMYGSAGSVAVDGNVNISIDGGTYDDLVVGATLDDSGEHSVTMGDVCITVDNGVFNGYDDRAIVGGASTAEAAEVTLGNVSVMLNGGTVNNNVYAAGYNAGNATATVASTTVGISSSVVFADGVVISGGSGGAGKAVEVTGDRILAFTSALRYANLDNIVLQDFDVVSVSEATATASIGIALESLNDTALTKTGEGALELAAASSGIDLVVSEGTVKPVAGVVNNFKSVVVDSGAALDIREGNTTLGGALTMNDGSFLRVNSTAGGATVSALTFVGKPGVTVQGAMEAEYTIELFSGLTQETISGIELVDVNGRTCAPTATTITGTADLLGEGCYLQYKDGALYLTNNLFPIVYWEGGTGVWDTTRVNWAQEDDTTPDTAFVDYNRVRFTNAVAPETITLDGDQHTVGMVVSNGEYKFEGDALSVVSGVLQVADKTRVTFNNALSAEIVNNAGTMVVAGGGLTLQMLTNTGVLNVTDGDLSVSDTADIHVGALSASGKISLAGKVTGGSIDAGSLELAQGGNLQAIIVGSSLTMGGNLKVSGDISGSLSELTILDGGVNNSEPRLVVDGTFTTAPTLKVNVQEAMLRDIADSLLSGEIYSLATFSMANGLGQSVWANGSEVCSLGDCTLTLAVAGRSLNVIKRATGNEWVSTDGIWDNDNDFSEGLYGAGADVNFFGAGKSEVRLTSAKNVGAIRVEAGSTEKVREYTLVGSSLQATSLAVNNGSLIVNNATGIKGNAQVGAAGKLTVGGELSAEKLRNEGSLSVTDGGVLHASTIENANRLTIDGMGKVETGNLLNTGYITLTDGGGLDADAVINKTTLLVGDGGTVVAEALQNDGTLSIGDGGSVTTQSLDNGGKLTVAEGGRLSILDGDIPEAVLEANEGTISLYKLDNDDTTGLISGTIEVSRDSGSYTGSYKPGTTVKITGPKVVQTLRPDENLSLAGTAGAVVLNVEQPQTKLSGINTENTSITLANEGVNTLVLTKSSSMQGGTLAFDVTAGNVTANLGGETPIITKGAELHLDGVNVVINQTEDDSVTNLPLAQVDQDEKLLLMTINDNEKSSFENTTLTVNSPLLNKYFKNIRLEKGSIDVVGDRETQYYEKHIGGLSGNGDVGVKMAGMVLSYVDPQNNREENPDLAGVLDAMEHHIAEQDKVAADKLGAAIAGAGNTALGAAFASDMDRQLRAIRNRTNAMGVSPDVDEHDGLPYHAWINAEGDYHSVDADGTKSGYSLTSWGATVGFAQNVTKKLTAGVALSGMMGKLSESADAQKIKADMNTYYATAFGRYATGAWTHNLVLSVGMADVDSDRTVCAGDHTFTAAGSTTGTSFGAMYELGYSFALTEDAMTTLQPIVNVSYKHASLDGFAEGASDAAVRYGSQTMDSFTIAAGARLRSQVAVTEFNHDAILEARALAKYEAGDRASETDVALVKLPRYSSKVQGAEVGSFGLELGVGLEVPMSGGSAGVFFDAAVELRSKASNANATVGYRRSF